MLLQFLQQGKRELEVWTLEWKASLCISLVNANHVIKGQLGCLVIKLCYCGWYQCSTASILFSWVGRGSNIAHSKKVSPEIFLSFRPLTCVHTWCEREPDLDNLLCQLCIRPHTSFEIWVCGSLGALEDTSFEHAVMDLFMFCLSHLNEGPGDGGLHLSSSWDGWPIRWPAWQRWKTIVYREQL